MAKTNLEIYCDDIRKEMCTFFDENYPATVTFKRGRKKKDSNGGSLYIAMLQKHWEYIEKERRRNLLTEIIMGGEK